MYEGKAKNKVISRDLRRCSACGSKGPMWGTTTKGEVACSIDCYIKLKNKHSQPGMWRRALNWLKEMT